MLAGVLQLCGARGLGGGRGSGALGGLRVLL